MKLLKRTLVYIRTGDPFGGDQNAGVRFGKKFSIATLRANAASVLATIPAKGFHKVTKIRFLDVFYFREFFVYQGWSFIYLLL